MPSNAALSGCFGSRFLIGTFAPGMTGEGASHHAVVVLPAVVRVCCGVNANESLAVRDKIGQALLEPLLALGRLLLVRILRAQAIPGGIEHENRIEEFQLFRLEEGFVFCVMRS